MKDKQTVYRFNMSKWKIVFLCFFTVVVVRLFFFSNYIVEGHSMNPTLEDGNLLIVNTFFYNIDRPDRFDIVVFQQGDQSNHYVKRVIGLPGEKIEYRNDTLYINEVAVKEKFISEEKDSDLKNNLTGDFTLFDLTGQETVPEGHVFVIGDNRLGSYDSRHFGFIKVEDIIGKVNMRYWPISGIN